jgi:hypothetical protein
MLGLDPLAVGILSIAIVGVLGIGVLVFIARKRPKE